MARYSKFLIPVAIAGVLAGCTTNDSGTKFQKLGLNGTNTIGTSADVRVVIEREVEPVTNPGPGRVRPTTVVCAEPSPDTAKAVQSAFGSGLGLGGTVPTGPALSAALQLSQSRAASLAALAERSLSIQLIRDGLYRACEAYANGAIGEVQYAVILSAIDETIITLLGAELAAGNFGRSLATLSGQSASEGSSEASAKTALETLQEINSSLDQSSSEMQSLKTSLQESRNESRRLESSLAEIRDEKRQLEGQIRALEGDLDLGPSDDVARDANGAPQAGQNRRLDDARSELTETRKREETLATELDRSKESERSLETSLKTEGARRNTLEQSQESMAKAVSASTAKAGATAAGSILPGKQSPELAETIAGMQRTYIENGKGMKSLMIACLVALDRPKGEAVTALTELCKEVVPMALAESMKAAASEQEYRLNRLKIEKGVTE